MGIVLMWVFYGLSAVVGTSGGESGMVRGSLAVGPLSGNPLISTGLLFFFAEILNIGEIPWPYWGDDDPIE